MRIFDHVISGVHPLRLALIVGLFLLWRGWEPSFVPEVAPADTLRRVSILSSLDAPPLSPRMLRSIRDIDADVAIDWLDESAVALDPVTDGSISASFERARAAGLPAAELFFRSGRSEMVGRIDRFQTIQEVLR